MSPSSETKWSDDRLRTSGGTRWKGIGPFDGSGSLSQKEPQEVSATVSAKCNHAALQRNASAAASVQQRQQAAGRMQPQGGLAPHL